MTHTNPRPPKAACFALSIRVAVWTALISMAVSTFTFITVVPNESSGHYIPWPEAAMLAINFDIDAHIPSRWEFTLSQGVDYETTLAVLVIPSVFLIIGTVIFHWLARKRLGQQPNFVIRTVLYGLSYIVAFTVSRTTAFLLVGGKIDSFADFAITIMLVGVYVAILVGISSSLFFAVLRITTKKKVALNIPLDTQSRESEELPLTSAEESALVQLVQADSRPMITCLQLAAKVALWATLASLAASAIVVGVEIEGTFLARHMNTSKFTAATIGVELMAHKPSDLSELYGQGSNKEQNYFILALIPGVIIVAGTVIFHWLARKRLGQQPNFVIRTMLYFASYAIAFLGVRIGALLFSGNGRKLEKLLGQPQDILQILGYMAGLIAIGSIITTVYSKSKTA